MFGFKKIRELERMNIELETRLNKERERSNALEKEVQRLAEEISAEASECCGGIGVWCKDCIHYAEERAFNNNSYFANAFARVDDTGYVRYCKEHIHDHCTDFVKKTTMF